MARKVVLIAFIILLAAVIYTVTAHAMRDEPQYHSYTKTIVSCDSNGNCVSRDLFIECLGDTLVEVTLVGKYPDAPEFFEGEDTSKWCD